MEERTLKVIINKAGGNASSGSLNYKLSIPSAWAKDMGITPEDRELKVTYDSERKEIHIKKNG